MCVVVRISGSVSATFDYWLKPDAEQTKPIYTHTWKSDFLSAVEFLNPAKTEKKEKNPAPFSSAPAKQENS